MNVTLSPATVVATVERYFSTLNEGQFSETAQLFADTGVLIPPFEEAIAGPTAIAHYLEQEAQDIKITPLDISITDETSDLITVDAKGKVALPWCNVNVAWQFLLNHRQEIVSVQVKLLATLQELMKFRSF